MTDNTQVMKALSQEDLTVIGNIKSLLDELIQQGGGMADTAKADTETVTDIQDPAVLEAQKAVDPEDKKIEAKKGVVETPSDAATGSSPAEERMTSPIPEETESNVNELARSIAKMLLGMGTQTVQKAQANPLVSAIQALAESQKVINNKVEKVSSDLNSFFEASGINEQLAIATKAALPEQNRKAIVSTDNDEVIKYLAGILNTVQKGENNNQAMVGPLSSNAQQVRKNLTNPAMYSHLLGDIELPGGND